ncbi:tyrosine-protein phosphatase [Alkalicoccus luteus]|uniref:tyrosine-protein phosphatase n=1 Tax=Alkalicoccus luteus TaxID=1237094 RepID=UPI004033F420
MIDIHSHLLPGLDDGAQTEADTLELAKAAVAEGITHVIATPHHKNGVYENEALLIEGAVEQTNELLRHHEIPLTVLPGQEVRLYGELLEDWRAGKLLTLNRSDYMLVEFPSNSIPRFATQLFYDMQLEGITPVIAHPERNKVLIEKPSLLYRYVQHGALSQLTAGSLAGKFGKKLQRFSLELLEHNVVHFVASDAHHVKTRGFHLQEAYLQAEKTGTVEQVKKHANQLLNQQMIYPEAPIEFRAKHFLERLFRK